MLFRDDLLEKVPVWLKAKGVERVSLVIATCLDERVFVPRGIKRIHIVQQVETWASVPR